MTLHKTFALLITVGSALLAQAAPHPEITVLPLGSTSISNGQKDRTFRLPHDAESVVEQPMVLVAAQPLREFPGVEAAAEGSGEPPKRQVEGTIKFSIAGQELPPWVLRPESTAYVISFYTIRKNPQFAKGMLALKAELVSSAAAV